MPPFPLVILFVDSQDPVGRQPPSTTANTLVAALVSSKARILEGEKQRNARGWSYLGPGQLTPLC
jgi:hypothetical protein